MIKALFTVKETKLITTIMLKMQGKKNVLPYDAVFDPGSTMTTMSDAGSAIHLMTPPTLNSSA